MARQIAIGYIRVSGENQADNASLPAQRAAIVEYCRKNDLILFNIFEDVQSGEDADSRSGLQFALGALYADLADCMVVHRLDRFARKVLDAERLKEEFKARGKRLITATEEVNLHSDSGELMFTVQSAFCEYERKIIKKRCNMGREKKRNENGYIGGQPPYGYNAVGRTLIPNMAEQEVIKQIYMLRSEGCTFAAIAHRLNSQKIRTKRGNLWAPGQVYRILYNFPPIAFRMGIEPLDLGA